MKYQFDGEIYLKLAELMRGPIAKLHPTASSLFIEDGNLFVVLGPNRADLPSFAYSATLVSPTLIVINRDTQTALHADL